MSQGNRVIADHEGNPCPWQLRDFEGLGQLGPAMSTAWVELPLAEDQAGFIDQRCIALVAALGHHQAGGDVTARRPAQARTSASRAVLNRS